MFLSENLQTTLQLTLANVTGREGKIELIRSVSGGSINSCYEIKYDAETYFLKVNRKEQYPDLFLTEAEGLKMLGEKKAITVPEVISFGAAADQQFLLLGWVSQGRNTSATQEKLGAQLALLHRNHSEYFGLDFDNYMGALPQSNKKTAGWGGFFVNHRLVPQIEIAIAKRLINRYIADKFETLYKKMEDLYPVEMPSFVHGDLWAGNYMINAEAEPVLVDPAVAFAYREVDIAMTTLFGGFDKAFYEAYNDNYPLEQGWKERLDLWNLYPLLIHLNLFGLDYLKQIDTIVSDFT